MDRPDWLDGTLDDALKVIAERYVLAKNAAAIDLQALKDMGSRAFDKAKDYGHQAVEAGKGAWDNEHVRNALLGAGLGAGGGLLAGELTRGRDEPHHRVRNALLGGLAGGAVGGGGSMLAGHMRSEDHKGPAKPDKAQ